MVIGLRLDSNSVKLDEGESNLFSRVMITDRIGGHKFLIANLL